MLHVRAPRSAEIDRRYEEAYRQDHDPAADRWGDVETFLDAAGRS